MKLFKMLVVVLFVFSIVFVSAEKPVESPRFESGIMGEIFEGLESAGGGGGQSVITSDELVGEWTYDAYASYSTNSLIDDDWTPGLENLFLKNLGGSIFFNDDGDGSYSITHQEQDPFYLITTNETETPSYTVLGDTLYRKCHFYAFGNNYSSIVSFSIKKITQNVIIFKFIDGPDFASKVVVCQKVLN